MIGYVTLGTNDLERGGAFYESLLAVAGAKKISTTERMVVFGTRPDAPMLMICTPFDKQEATFGNGVMVALKVDSQEIVDQMHAKALELGGTDEGAPGPRGDSGAYFAYFRDLDGNKIAAFQMG
ncbi:MAG: VOC family protein [bacterium]|nr:glyoxalase [Deltaproteobacteria bacterium]MCP4908005.1 VOC family protein [bacterium]